MRFGVVRLSAQLVISGQMDPKSFAKLTCALTGLALLGVAIFNFVVNPYAQYGTRIFKPIVQESRLQKLALLDSADPIPSGLILGSSRVLKFEPEYIESKTGVTFFNAGVNYGKPEDYLAILRRYREQFGRAPKIVLLGIDPIALSDAEPTDARMLGISELSGQVPEFLSLQDRCQRWSDLLTWSQLNYSLKSIRSSLKNETKVPIESFRSDGVLVYHQREAEIKAGTYDFPAALQYNKREYKHFYLRAKKLSVRRTRVMQTLFDSCDDWGTKLYVFMTSYHPELESHLMALHSAPEYRLTATTFVQELCVQHEGVFCDLTNIQSFDGDESLFVDGIHPLEPNTRRMIDALLSAEIGEQKHAVQ